jgi:hypothetical protein
LQRKRESWASSAALPWTAACTEDATGNAFRCYFFFSVGPRADAERWGGGVWTCARSLARVCARAGVVRACGRAGAAAKHRGRAFSVWEHECVRRM